MAWPHDTYIDRYSDDELDDAIIQARAAAHAVDPPSINQWNLHADGTREILNQSMRWARCSALWVKLCDEKDRRRSGV